MKHLFELRPVPSTSASTGSAPFDRGAAARALGSVDVRRCAGTHGPTGVGHVTLTFEQSGHVSSVVVDGGPFPGTPTGGCIAGLFRSISVPPFSNPPTRVGKSFSLP